MSVEAIIALFAAVAILGGLARGLRRARIERMYYETLEENAAPDTTTHEPTNDEPKATSSGGAVVGAFVVAALIVGGLTLAVV